MKRLILALLATMLAATLSMSAVASEGVKHVFNVNKIDCPYCVIAAEKPFQKMKGVKKVVADKEEGTVTVYTDKSVCFTKKQLEGIFKKSGLKYISTVEQPKDCDKA